MTERVGMEITVDAKQAQAEIQNIRKGAMQLKESLEKQAGAIAAVTMAFGHQDGAIGKVIRGVGGLAVAYGSAGPLGVALAATAAAVELLNSHWEESIALQDKALMASFTEQDRATAMLRKTNDEIAKMRDELLPLTKAQREYRDTMREVAEVEAAMARIRADGKLKTDDQRNALRLYEQTLDRLQTKANLQQAVAGKGSGAAKASGGAAKSGAAAPTALDVFRSREANRAEIDEANRKAAIAAIRQEQADIIDAYSARAEAQEERAKALNDAMADAERARTEFERAQAEERVAIAQAEHDAKMANAMQTGQVLGDITAATANLTAQAIGGQVSSLEDFAAEMIRIVSGRVGGELIVQGAGKVASGAASMIATGGVVGSNVIAAGLFEATAGAAIVGGGIAAASAIAGSGPGAARGGSGGGGGGVGTGERGFGRRSRQSAGGGGASDKPAQVINVYGVDGPQAEDQARRTVRSNRLARRRGFA